MELNVCWFVVLGALLAGYAVLDGFDLGAGIVYLGFKKEEDRRTVLNAIGPLWDGNEVWLITFGGALFAAFPQAYATAFSAYYTAFMLLLFALIFRGVSLEFRGKRPEPAWRGFWDVAFSVSSALATFLFGVAVGGLIRGLPIGPDKEYAGTFWDLLGFYPIVVGLLAVALFALHGALFLHLKSSGDMEARLRRWIGRLFDFFAALYVLATLATLVKIPSAIAHFHSMPVVMLVAAAITAAVVAIPWLVSRGRAAAAFLASSLVTAALVFLFGFAIYPNLLLSSLNPAWSLTLRNAASSHKTLGLMGAVALIGMPFVIAYTIVIYRVFRGKVDKDKLAY